MKNTNLKFMGRNIRILRRRSGYTLSELANKIGMQEGPLGRLERGLNAPSAKAIYNLSQILGVSTDTLFAETPIELQKQHDLNSSRPCLTQLGRPALTPKMEETANRLIDSYFALEEICDARKHAGIPFQLFFYKEEAGIEDLVESVRKFLNINDGIVFNYFELFESFGFRIISAPFLKDLSSFSYFDAPNQNAFFFVNSTLNQERQLFSLAFELGMIYMWEQYMSSNQEDTDFDVIKAARKFAAFFLMPKETITRTVKQLGISPSEWTYDLLIRIKHRFGVSAESFLYRLNELDLIDKIPFTKIKQEILAFYDKHNFKEPGNSKRTSSHNGRLFDLLQLAQTHEGSVAETKEISQLFAKFKIIGH